MKQLDELKTELGQLRVQKIAGGAASKLTKMYVPLSFSEFGLCSEICARQILKRAGRISKERVNGTGAHGTES